MYDTKTRAMVEAMLNGGPDGIAAFKRWAINQPFRWDIGLPSKEAAEAKLAILRKGTKHDHVLYILQAENGTWDVWSARLHRKPEEIDALAL